MDGATAQQQQRMIDMLQLRSDELTAENGKLRMQMAKGDKQLPGQLQSDYPFSQMSSPKQNEYMATHQHALPAGGFNKGWPLRAAGQSQVEAASYSERWE